MEIAALLRLSSDQRLAEQVYAGSERAFEVLYDRHHRGVLAFCRHMLDSREEAEDALQHTFMAAYRDLRRSGAPAAVRPWLFVIARNRSISVLRARREHPAADVPERATDHLATEVAVREELRAVLTAVARLPDDQRAALVLAELGDVSHDDIARILDCRREQVKSYVYQARATLATDRIAREMPCSDIREQLAEMHGGQLRRAPLRRHLHDCVGCREFRETLRTQRTQLGLLLPVAPSLGLKRAVLGAALGGSGGAGGLSLGGVAATALMVVAIPAGTAAVASGSDVPAPNAPAVRTSAPGATASPVATKASRSAARRSDRHSAARRVERLPRATPEPATRTEDQPPKRADEPADTPNAAPRDAAPAAEPATPERPSSPPEQATPKSPPGQSDPTNPATPPGQAKTPPGQDRTPPGQAKTPPGQDKTRPSQAKIPPGQAKTPPGQAKIPPAQSKPTSAPGQDRPNPGEPASPPGQDSKRAEAKPEPGPRPSPPGQAKEPGLPEGDGSEGRPGARQRSQLAEVRVEETQDPPPGILR